MPTISIIIPCFNEGLVIPQLIERLNKIVLKLEHHAYEVIFIDDGSSDATFALLAKYQSTHSWIKVLGFARNFGHQVAVSAGIDHAIGDATIIMDADLQDPPEVVLEMIQKWQEGYDVVYGVREQRVGESWFKLLTAKYFYRLLQNVSEITIPLDSGDFRLLSRRVVDLIKKMPEQDRFLRGMVAWVGFKQFGLRYVRDKRYAGDTKYPLKKMIAFALDGILSFSKKPLRIASFFGGLFIMGSLVALCVVLLFGLLFQCWSSGIVLILIAMFFIGGIQLLCLGILGEYLGRLYSQSKNRPLYVIGEKLGFD
ncbi:MAG: glycosyltransferase family 2 protein [Methylacidiphilales bacterium]|nr:glycosyltransferase family 2 protein [Candidatus Methylacidiphilales bacterium]